MEKPLSQVIQIQMVSAARGSASAETASARVLMKEPTLPLLVRGFLFASTQATEPECFNRLLLATEKAYGPVVMRVRKDDLLFLNNIDTNTLHGVFRATSDGGFNIQPEAWNGKYPYQVKVELLGDVVSLVDAKGILNRFGLGRNKPLFGSRLADVLGCFLSSPRQLDSSSTSQGATSNSLILKHIESIRARRAKVDIEPEIPLVEATTFWDFPAQSYGLTSKGDNRYPGVTPAGIIYNLVWRYTDPGDLVVDPMCGSGTTIDVCREEKRRVIGYDISPVRKDIIQNDARSIPLDDNSADMVFIDSPYGDNIRYNDHPDNIGNISSESDEFYDELEKVMKESYRILKEGKVLGWLIGDQWVKHKFTPVGLKIYTSLCNYFEPLDIICVARRSQSSNTPVWYTRARRHNFYLRGFKYLIIVRKSARTSESTKRRKIEWASYYRGR